VKDGQRLKGSVCNNFTK